MSQAKKAPSATTTIAFVVVLCFVCAAILATLAAGLKELQGSAAALDRAKQMLMSAKLFHPDGYFLLDEGKENYVPAKLAEQNGRLVKGDRSDIADADAIFTVYNKRIIPFLVDAEGKETTFQAAGIDLKTYLEDYRKTGYDNQPLKLVYRILSNPAEGQAPSNDKVDGYIFHISGFGLWDAIYGYLAVAKDGDTVIGISWYEHKETPGLGANIAEPSFQSHFPGKKIFQSSPTGKTDFARAPLGITVVRGLVSDVYPSGPKAESAVDGMAGATLTGNGVTKAYKDTLASYRPFLLRLVEASSNDSGSAAPNGSA
ncbi:MAG: NADH:ubiquinone reductase (Na(+)-transporting) subunit C [Chlamydiia bacterium]|nr:NADH:ubiquinone reductase (Na(+)-transporting) subunit C [Chlamydiia bacterium]